MIKMEHNQHFNIIFQYLIGHFYEVRTRSFMAWFQLKLALKTIKHLKNITTFFEEPK